MSLANIQYNNNSFVMRGISDEDLMIKRMQNNNQFYELQLLQYINSLNLSGVFVDVGANIGNHSIWLSNFANFDYGISIEGHPEIFKCLEANCNANITKQQILINSAISNKEELVIFKPINAFNVGGTAIDHNGVLNIDDGQPYEELFPSFKIQARTIDTILEEQLLPNSHVSFIKMDIEGCELLAIEGACKIIEKYTPVLSVEFWHQEQLNIFKDIMLKYNYKLLKKFDNNSIWGQS